MTRKIQKETAAAPALPLAPALDISALAAAFRDTATSYKYLWLQAILRALHRGEFEDGFASLRLLAAHMFDIAKYPLRRFHLFFGWEDKIASALRDLEDAAGWRESEYDWFDREIVARQADLPAHVYKGIVKFAPYRLLAPFFGDELKGLGAAARHHKIARLANDAFDSRRPPLYRFSADGESIEISPAWRDYILANFDILRGWALWHWCGYLQGQNPNIPAISRKLEKPQAATTARQRHFWRWIIGKRAGEIRCLYSGEVLRAERFALDHFLPWDFIGHDNLWNLAPTMPEANSAKSNRLPSGDYLSGFVALQHIALSTFCASGRTQWNALTESYLADLRLRIVTPSAAPDLAELRKAYSMVVPPLARLAENCGFRPGWRWKKSD